MEVLKDIFVPYEIAQKLKEIGFNEDCIGAYDCYCMLHIINSNDRFSLSENEIFVYTPTYEQVFKWFRDKGYIFNIFSSSDLSYIGEIFFGNKFLGSTDFFNSYEQAREALILKLIEVYKNGKTDI